MYDGSPKDPLELMLLEIDLPNVKCFISLRRTMCQNEFEKQFILQGKSKTDHPLIFPRSKQQAAAVIDHELFH